VLCNSPNALPNNLLAVFQRDNEQRSAIWCGAGGRFESASSRRSYAAPAAAAGVRSEIGGTGEFHQPSRSRVGPRADSDVCGLVTALLFVARSLTGDLARAVTTA
jgi:hypothetical protein